MNKVFDLHNDFLLKFTTGHKKHGYLKNKKTLDAGNIVSAVWTTEMSQEKAIKTIQKCFNFVEDYNKQKLPQNTNLRLAIEDLHFITKNYLYELINYHPIYCGLTWNHDNLLAGGANEGGDISLYGLNVIEELESNNIFVEN